MKTDKEITIEVIAGVLEELIQHYTHPDDLDKSEYTPVDYLESIDESLEDAFDCVEENEACAYEVCLGQIMINAVEALVDLRTKRVKDDQEREAVDAEVEAEFEYVERVDFGDTLKASSFFRVN